MRTLMMGLTAFAAATLFATIRTAGADDLSCRQQAREEYHACKADCRDDFRSAKFACRGIEPSCGTACLAGRMACFDDVEAIRDTGQLPNGGGTLENCSDGTDGCKQRFEDAKAACGAPCNGNTTCIGCVNDAQVTNFICRDTCRDSWRLNPTVITLKQSCRDTFRACVQACPQIP